MSLQVALVIEAQLTKGTIDCKSFSNSIVNNWALNRNIRGSMRRPPAAVGVLVELI